jgi:hypothetical protein
LTKRNKQSSQPAKRAGKGTEAPSRPSEPPGHAPSRNVPLLITSAVLFSLWLVFLIITALAG